MTTTDFNEIVYIHKATYGIGDNVVDVSETVQKLVSKSTSFKVHTGTMGTDPCPGKQKELIIHYSLFPDYSHTLVRHLMSHHHTIYHIELNMSAVVSTLITKITDLTTQLEQVKLDTEINQTAEAGRTVDDFPQSSNDTERFDVMECQFMSVFDEIKELKRTTQSQYEMLEKQQTMINQQTYIISQLQYQKNTISPPPYCEAVKWLDV